MAEMSKELMELINGGGYCYVGTASKDGMPNMCILGSTRAVSPDTIIMAAGFMNKGLKNLEENPIKLDKVRPPISYSHALS